MTDIDCNLFPEDQACDTPIEADPDMDKEWDDDKDWDHHDKDGMREERMEMMKHKMMEAQFTFLGMAIGVAAGSAMQLFRYRSDSNYYANGTTVFGDRNYWELSNIIPQYYFLGMGSLAAFTQLLAIFGVGAALNMMVWIIGMGAIGGIVMAISGGLSSYGYDKAYTVVYDSNSTVAEMTAADAVMFAFKFEWLISSVEAITAQLEMQSVAKAWVASNAVQMDKGDKKGKKHGKGGRGKGEDSDSESDMSDDEDDEDDFFVNLATKVVGTFDM